MESYMLKIDFGEETMGRTWNIWVVF